MGLAFPLGVNPPREILGSRHLSLIPRFLSLFFFVPFSRRSSTGRFTERRLLTIDDDPRLGYSANCRCGSCASPQQSTKRSFHGLSKVGFDITATTTTTALYLYHTIHVFLFATIVQPGILARHIPFIHRSPHRIYTLRSYVPSRRTIRGFSYLAIYISVGPVVIFFLGGRRILRGRDWGLES